MKPIIQTFNCPTHHPNPNLASDPHQEDVEYRVGSWVTLYVLVFRPKDAIHKSQADELKLFREQIMNWQFEVHSYVDCDPSGKGTVLTTRVPMGLSPDVQRLYIHDICYDMVSEMMEEVGLEIYARMQRENGNLAMGEREGGEDVDMDLGGDVDMFL